MENKIKYLMIDGRPAKDEIRGGKTIYADTVPLIFSCEEIDIKTPHILCLGNIVDIGGRWLTVRRVVYSPKEDAFTFDCGEYFTGREA